jgi:hypothetical protein
VARRVAIRTRVAACPALRTSLLTLTLLFFAGLSFGQELSVLDAERARLGFPENGIDRLRYDVPAAPQDSSLEYLGFWGWGACGGVAAMGNYVFTGSGPTLLWLDVTDTRNPVVVWDTLVAGGLTHMIIQDSIGYALMGTYRLLIVDFRNPLRPVILSQLQFPLGLYLDLVVEGTLAFVKRWNSYTYCIDVSDPTLPYIRSTFLPLTEWGRLAISNRNLYLADRGCCPVYHIDVSNPDSARYTPLTGLPLVVRTLYAKDTLLLIGTSQLYIYSIATPTSPMLLSNIMISTEGVYTITLKGDTAFVGSSDRRVTAVDISDRINPVNLGTYTPPIGHQGSPWELAAEDTVLFASYATGMKTLSVANPSSISLLSYFPTGYQTKKVIVRTGLAYVTSGGAGLWVVDLSDPLHPRRVGNIQTAGEAYDLVIDSNIAYLSLSSGIGSGIWTIDIGQPESMTVLDTIMLNSPYAISKSGSLLLVTHNRYYPETTLTVLDVSDPSSIQYVSGAVAGNTREITSKDSIAFVATSSGFGSPNPGLNIYDCRSPANPQLRSTTLGHARGVSVSGNLAYVHRGDSTFVVDITDLTSPVIVGRVRHPPPGGSGYDWESRFSHNRLFWSQVIKWGVVDVSNPYQPSILFETEWGGGGGIDVVGDTIYVTTDVSGVAIYRHKFGSTSVGHEPLTIPHEVRLFPNYPNPFNPSTKIRFEVPGSGTSASSVEPFVLLKVYNLLGQEVATLVSEELSPGSYTTVFDGSGLPSGVYFYRLTSSGRTVTQRMMILR